MAQDPETCDHEWVSDGDLEVYPPISTWHCVKCGLRRHIKSASGEITYYPPSRTADPSRPVGPDDPPRS
jgi:hypothetical protein